MATLDRTVKDIPSKAIDPVCGMEVESGGTKSVSTYEGRHYWFCAEACRKAFEVDPVKYLESKPKKKKGWFARYLAKMAKVNEKEFGCAGPGCH